jgi:hypothetical protein
MTPADHSEVVDLWLAPDKAAPPDDMAEEVEHLSETEPEEAAATQQKTLKQRLKQAMKSGAKKAAEWVLHGLDRAIVLLTALGIIHLLRKAASACGVEVGRGG